MIAAIVISFPLMYRNARAAMEQIDVNLVYAGRTLGMSETIAQKIAMVIQDGDYVTAGIWVSVVVLIAFVIIFLMNFISGRKMKNIGRW